ncbi:MAG: hypothetical protein ACYC4H_11460 [Desulfocucumaceae bacterium]
MMIKVFLMIGKNGKNRDKIFQFIKQAGEDVKNKKILKKAI